MAVKDSGKVLGKEIANEVKKVSDNITSPFKQFMPGLIAGLPGGAIEKSFKALSISNKKEQDDTTTELKEQTGLLGGMNSGLAKLSDTLTNQNKTLIGTIAGQDKGGLSAAEVEKANEERRREENQITLLEKISGGISNMLKGFLNATAAGAGMGLGAVLGLIAAPFVTIAAFFKSLKAEIKVLDRLLGGKLGAPFVAIKSYLTKVRDALKVGDKVDDLILGAKTAIANLKTFFGNWVGKLKIADKVDDIVLGAKNAMASVKGFFSGFVGKFKAGTLGVVDDIILGAKNGIASVKTFFSGFAGKLNIVDKADDLVLGAKNGVASVKTFFTGFKGQLTIADTAADLLAPVKSTFASIKGFLAPFKALTILPAAAAGAGAAGKTAETAVDGAKAGVNAIKGIMATVKSFMSPLRLGLVAMDAVVATMQPIIKFAGTLGTVLGKIFMPITILMSVFDLVTGFMDGYDEEGTIIAGMEGGISKMLVGLVGIPLDFLKAGIAWLGTKMGFDMTWMSEFSFSDMISGLVGKVFDGIQGMIDFVKDLFDFSDLTIFEVFGKLIDIVFAPLNLAINFVKGLFGWGSDDENAEPFSLSGLIFDTAKSIFDWFAGLFDIDIMGLIKSIPGAGKVLSWFGFGDEEPPEESPEAKQNKLDKERLEANKDEQALTAMEMEEISQRMDKFEKGQNAYFGRDTEEKYLADKELFEKLLAREGELERANLALQEAIADGQTGSGTTVIDNSQRTTNQNGGARMAMPIPISNNQAWEAYGY